MPYLFALISLLFCAISARAQSYSLSGVLRSHVTHSPLTDAYVWRQGVPDTTFADSTGNYQIFLPSGVHFVYFGGAQSCDSMVSVTINNANVVRDLELLEPNAEFSVTSISDCFYGVDVTMHFQIANPAGECPLTFVITDTSDWLDVVPAVGELSPDATLEIDVTALAAFIPPGHEYASALHIDYNASGGPYVIPVVLADCGKADELYIASPASIVVTSFPNPFNSITTISFTLPHESPAALTVFDLRGREVASQTHEMLPAGNHAFTFDGFALPSGLYFARLAAGSEYRTEQLILLK